LPGPPTRQCIFPYEIYTDEDALKKHPSSRQSKEFDIAIREWVKRKSIRKLKLLKQ
jgi:quinol monooxygenase YgiN